MLKHICIKNYALIRELDLELQSGLTTITGETGAGKSILLGALGLILGKRADTSVLSDKSQKCTIEGTFILENVQIKRLFNEFDLDYENESIIRREITASGKSRAFINDTPVNLNMLKEIGKKLVDIHSQHQSLLIDDPYFQLAIIDAFSGTAKELELYKSKFREYTQKSSVLESLKQEQAIAEKDADYIAFQLNEIEAGEFEEGDEEHLESEQQKLENAGLIKQRLQQSAYTIYENENAIHAQLNELIKAFDDIKDFSDDFKALYDRMQSLNIELKDLYDELSKEADSVFIDEELLEEVSNRYNTLNKLLRKHQCNTATELLEIKEELSEKLQKQESQTEEIKKLTKELSELKAELYELANHLSEKRQAVFDHVSSELVSLLSELGMPDARFEIKHERTEKPGNYGLDHISFFFTANKGHELKPLGDAASGGERSRLMLALKYLQTGNNVLPTIIFDEIDTGISGGIALRAGQLMQRLSEKHQVISITHLPQIAALGKQHMVVFKDNENGKTQTYVRKIDKNERTLEIAKMLSGEAPTENAIQNAKDLITNYTNQ